ncbi:MAG TPA: PHP domain-containing protein, partial [Sorangium sp.]|nr:PHP domain-containing protein [Sorangium sp.]
MSFAELLAHSCFSFLEGASQPVELAERAVQQRLSALALCDRDGLYGSVRLHVAAKRLKLPVIVGAELTLETALAPAYAQHAVPTVALLVQDSAGYGALCRLLTSAHAHSDKGQAAIPLAAICEDACGLSAVVPWSLQHPLGEEQLGMLRDAFGARLSIAVWRHLRIDDEARTKAAQRLAAQFEVPIVASNRPFYHHRSRKPLSDVLACIRLKTTLDEAGTRLTPNAEAELKGARAMHKLFPHHPQWLAESIAIAERCTFSLSEVKYSFPSDYGASNLTADENLRRAVEVGCRERYPTGVPVDVAHQIDKELSIIAQLQV